MRDGRADTDIVCCAATSVPPRSLSYNPAENAVLVGSDAENGSYELYVVPKDAKGESSPVSLTAPVHLPHTVHALHLPQHMP